MPLFTKEASLHHVCQMCAYFRTDLAHEVVERIETPSGYSLVIECPSCGARECFNTELEPEEEQTGHLGHRQQAQHVRLLQQHLGHPRIEETRPNVDPGAPTATIEPAYG